MSYIGIGTEIIPGKEADYSGSIPSNEIDVVNAFKTNEYAVGNTARAKGAIKALQSAVGVFVDGKLGANTAKATVAKLEDVYRRTSNVTAATILGRWRASGRPFSLAVWADKIAALVKPKTTSNPVTDALASFYRTGQEPQVQTSPSPFVVTEVPPPVLNTAGFGTGGGLLGSITSAKIMGVPIWIVGLGLAGAAFMSGGMSGSRAGGRRRRRR